MRNKIQSIVQRCWKSSLALLAAAIVATACSDKDDDTQPVNPAQPDEPLQPSQPAQPSQPDATERTFSVSIPASINGDGSLSKAIAIDGTKAVGKFQSNEKIYVFNKTIGQMLSGTLSPENISNDGKRCTLTGTLSGSITISDGENDGDELVLLYNMNVVNEWNATFSYWVQTGLASDLLDGGIASGIKAESFDDGMLITNGVANFELLQSVFRFQFTDGTNSIGVKSLRINSGGIAANCRKGLYFQNGEINVDFVTPTSDYIYAALCFIPNVSTNSLSFTVIDDDGSVYTGTKTLSGDKTFQNGKYYYNNSAILLTYSKRLAQPTITLPSEGGVIYSKGTAYFVSGPNSTAAEFSISGNSEMYRVEMPNCGTVTISDLNAECSDSDYSFITSEDELTTIDVQGENNIIKCANFFAAIYCYGNLKFKGEGSLTVTVNGGVSVQKGLSAGNWGGLSGYNLTDLATEGYTVSLDDENGTYNEDDDTYSWTFIVAPTSSK